VGEVPDWQELRSAGAAIKDEVLLHLDRYLEQFEAAATARGARVHWARDAAEANSIVCSLVKATGQREVIKVKSMTTQEMGLDSALAVQHVEVIETDLAELIVQLGDDRPSHILVPAIHKNRAEIREIFLSRMGDAPPGLTDDPHALAEAARRHLRKKFLRAKVAISGANFAIAETGSLLVVESEGNGRMCLTLPETLISVVGIEKLLPTFRDLEVFLQLLPRSSTGERMNPYTSLWTGVTPGDGPQEVHIVLLDNGRTDVLRDEIGRQALRCIRCSACLNVCPVYERTGGHAYAATYPGPIGAILTPQLVGVEHASKLPFASSLCGYCYEVCPVKIDIPSVLVKLRHDVVRAVRHRSEDAMFGAAAAAMKGRRRWTHALRLASLLRFVRRGGPPPVAQWTSVRDLPEPPAQSFRDWWVRERQ
jgi:L-lactate dehydrogenase complex protein LldF